MEAGITAESLCREGRGEIWQLRMSGKEKALGSLIGVGCELGTRPEALSSGLSVISG